MAFISQAVSTTKIINGETVTITWDEDIRGLIRVFSSPFYPGPEVAKNILAETPLVN